MSSTHTTPTLRVVAATPISDEHISVIRTREPRVEFICDHSLLPPMRYPGDHGGDPDFRRTPDQQAAFDELLSSADVLYGIPDESSHSLARAIEANPRLRWVHTMAAGGGAQVRRAHLSEDAVESIIFTTSAGVHAKPLAEFALFGLLAGAKTLPALLTHQRAHHWAPRWMMPQLRDQTVLILGMGSIGKETARLLDACGVTVLGISRSESSIEHVTEVLTPGQMDSALGRVDGIVVTLPSTEATHHLLEDRFFAQLKSGTTLVNVGRGSVIDEDALVRAIHSGSIGFAALDVFDVEPLPESSPLWDLPQVLICPHTSALQATEDLHIAELFATNAQLLLDGEPMLNVMSTREFY